MENQTELKPKRNQELRKCPFCGGKADIVQISWCRLFSARCVDEYHNCKVIPETQYFSDKQEAIEAWNRRAGDEE